MLAFVDVPKKSIFCGLFVHKLSTNTVLQLFRCSYIIDARNIRVVFCLLGLVNCTFFPKTLILSRLRTSETPLLPCQLTCLTYLESMIPGRNDIVHTDR